MSTVFVEDEVAATMYWLTAVFFSAGALDLYEPQQLDLIVYDSDRQREGLYLKVNFTVDDGQEVEQFGWVLAVPPNTTAEESEDGLFVELMDMTRPHEEEFSPFGCVAASGNLSGDDGRSQF